MPLVIAPGLKILCEAADRYVLKAGAARCTGGPHTLRALDSFRYPSTVRDALHGLKTSLTGSADWMMLSSTIAAMVDSGVLIGADQPDRAQPLRGTGFDGESIHAAMLNDRTRTDSYLAAIAQTVKAGDTVIDLGTGTGILAMAAARAGAAKVYAIEATNVAEAAQRLFTKNGLTDRIELVRGHSTRIELPQRADVLISEIIGDDPLGEQLLVSTADALKRLLKPTPRVLPSRLEIWASAVTVPSLADQNTFEAVNLTRWQRHYGFDFGPLTDFAQEPAFTRHVSAANARRLEQLAPAVRLASFDLSQPKSRILRSDFDLHLSRTGRIDGILVWFRMQLSEGVTLETAPSSFRPDNHWQHPLYLLREPIALQKQQRCRFSLDLGAAQPTLQALRAAV